MNRRGFTLVEFVICIAAGVTIAMLGSVLYAPVRNWDFLRDRRHGMEADTAAVMKIVREVGRIKDPSLMTTMTASSLAFTDVDDVAVSFSLSGGNILRGADILANNVTGLTFTYLDKTGAVTAVAANVRVIKVNIVMNSGGQTVRLEAAERLRNFP
jgi:prepilin-type N-terminal cleavage/methylation domain-containing protein